MSYEEHIDDYQARLNTRLPGDDGPIRISTFEAEKCAAVVDAYLGGLELYRPAVRAVERFLRARSAEGRTTGAAGYPTSAEAWETIRETPWPPPRRMWPNPDPTR